MVLFQTFRRSQLPVSWLGFFCCFLQQDGSRNFLYIHNSNNSTSYVYMRTYLTLLVHYVNLCNQVTNVDNGFFRSCLTLYLYEFKRWRKKPFFSLPYILKSSQNKKNQFRIKSFHSRFYLVPKYSTVQSWFKKDFGIGQKVS